MARPKSDLQRRFWLKVDKQGGDEQKCWLWKASTFRRGYGQITVDGKNVKAHRLSYSFVHGEIAAGIVICHKCDVTSCVNPKHLFSGTVLDNVRDQIFKNRRHNVNGASNGMAKLNQDIVNEIRVLYAAGISQRKIAGKYGIIQGHVSDIVNFKRWK